ncbi:MAG: murein biosynthesis integral membrane protein MurJ [Thermoleophilia bacterium]|nr:murein biosynthesis integral membrane protein MurJ [Thermoleophilia bacterium]
MSEIPIIGAETPLVGRRLATAAMIVVGATAASRVFGYIREITTAAYFGAGADMSAFDVAFLVPATVQIIIAQAALSAALIPVFAGLLEKDQRQEAWLVARTVFTLVTLIMGSIVIVCILFAPQIMPIFAPGYRDDPMMMAEIVRMTRLLFPIVVLLALTGIVASILNSFGHFTLPAVAPIFWNMIILAAIIFGHERLGVDALAWGILLGTVVQLAMQLPALRGRGGRLGWSMAWRNPHVRQVGALLLPVSVSLGLINLNGVVDVQFASFLGTGGVAAMTFAFRLYQLPEALFAIAVGTVLFPTLSRIAARNDMDAFRSKITLGLRVIFFLLIPASAFLLALHEPIVRLAYEHGRFTAENTELVSSALLFFAFGSAFSGGSTLLIRGFFSMGRPWLPTTAAIGNLAVNAILNWIFIKPFGLGGIPLSTSVVSAVTFIVLLALMRRELGRIDGRAILRSGVAVLIVSAIAAATAYCSWWALDHWLGRSLTAQIIAMGSAFAAGIAVFSLLALAAKMPELKLVRKTRRG